MSCLQEGTCSFDRTGCFGASLRHVVLVERVLVLLCERASFFGRLSLGRRSRDGATRERDWIASLAVASQLFAELESLILAQNERWRQA